MPARQSFHKILLISTLVAMTACSESQQATQTDTVQQTYNTTLEMKDFMNLVLEPVADVLWDSAGWVDSVDFGYQELYPTTPEEWEEARRQSAMIIEIGNALAVPGRAIDNDAWVTYANGLSSAGQLAMNAAATQNKEDFFQAGAQLYSVCSACHQAYNPEISRFTSN